MDTLKKARYTNPMMGQSSFQKSFRILHSFFTPVVIAFFLESQIFTLLFSDRIVNLSFGWLIPLLIFPFKIYFYSGIYGILTEMTSGATILFHTKDFPRAAQENWPIVLVISILPLAIHFLTFIFVPDKNVTLTQVAFYGDLIFVFLLAQGILARKYFKPDHLPRRTIRMTPRESLILIGLLLSQISLYHLPQFIDGGLFDLPRISIFLSRYLHFLSFLYVIQLILNEYPEITAKFMAEKQLILINPLGPGILEAIGSIFIRSYPPVFVVLKALTPKSYQFKEFNRVLWQSRYYGAAAPSNALVAITCFTSNCAEAYKIAKEFRKRGCKVIMGGPHVSYLIDEALEYCDSVVVGEAEGVWPQVVKDYENNCLKKKYDGASTGEYHQMVHQELLNSPPEVIKDYLETTRGCKFKCHFCTIPSFSGGRTRRKPVFEVVELIEKIKPKYRNVTFIDNNIYSDPAYARELFKALKPLNVKWTTQCTIDIAKNDETLQLAKEAGCVGFLFGYEIYEESQAKEQGGKYSMVDNYLRFTKKIKKAGINIKAHYIFGYDTDNFKSLGRLWKFCFSVRPLFTIVSLLTPLPGSVLYDDMVRENRLTNLNWHNYACHSLVFRHKQMNNTFLSALYPAIYFLFLLTTSQGGFIFLGLLLFASIF